MEKYQVCVIGGGPGGYVAAIRAAQKGVSVALVEKGPLGGVCLNKGCIPTKTLLNTAEKWQELAKADEFGLMVGEAAYDWEKISNRKSDVIHQLRKGVEKLLSANKIAVYTGVAHLQSTGVVRIEPDHPEDMTEIACEKLILATGSEPVKPPLPGIDLPGVLTSDELLKLEEVPASLLVIGAGAVGAEFAGIYAAFGCAVTLVEMAPAIVPICDADVQKRMALALRKQGIKIMTAASVKEIKAVPYGLRVTVEVKGQPAELEVEKVLVATGRRPVLAAEELTALGIEFSKQGIKVNPKMETTVSGIYAIGDVTGRSMLAHAASHQGIVAAENACGNAAEMDYRAIPGCIFTSPEIAWVGLNEQECHAQEITFRANKFNFAGNGKALLQGQTEGFVKLIAEETTHKIIGCHIMGPHASDLIMEGVLAVQLGLTAEELTECIHPHPTLAETVGEAALGLFGSMLHQGNSKK